MVELVLSDFNAGKIDAVAAGQRLGLGRSRLYTLRTRWLAGDRDWTVGVSGGNRRGDWPQPITDFLRDFLPDCTPLNCALISDELLRRFDFPRSRAAVSRYLIAHFPSALERLARPGPRPRRRWQCAHVGELWQHDSSIHQWWAGPRLQTLILTEDDHSRKLLAAHFEPSDTTWGHFCHFRAAFQRYGLPRTIYTDALSLFGHQSLSAELKPSSQFQRALLGLGINHRIAPDPQAKGKIERRFGHLQKRLVTLLRHQKVRSFDQANLLLDGFIDHYNSHHRCRTTGLTPNASWQQARRDKRFQIHPCPPKTLLDLHLAIHFSRRRNLDNTIELFGSSYPIAPCSKPNLTIVLHPSSRFWVIPASPSPDHPVWPTILASHSLPISPVHF